MRRYIKEILYRCYRNSGIFLPFFGTADLSYRDILRGKQQSVIVDTTKQEHKIAGGKTDGKI